MDKNSFKELLKKTADMFSKSDDVENFLETIEGCELYDMTCHEVLSNLSYQERSDPTFKRVILKLMHWRHSMDETFPEIQEYEFEEKIMTPSNVVDFSSFRKQHSPRRNVG